MLVKDPSSLFVFNEHSCLQGVIHYDPKLKNIHQRILDEWNLGSLEDSFKDSEEGEDELLDDALFDRADDELSQDDVDEEDDLEEDEALMLFEDEDESE